HISGITLDPTGFLWIGSRRGIQRFDGNSFQDVPLPASCHPNDASPYVPHTVDEQSRLVFSVGKNLFRFDGLTGICRSLSTRFAGILARGSTGTLLIVEHDRVYLLTPDGETHRLSLPDWTRVTASQPVGQDGFLLAAQTERHSVLFSIRESRATTVYPLPGVTSPIRSLLTKPDGSIVYATGSEVSRFDPETGQQQTVLRNESNNIVGIVDDQADRIWIVHTDFLTTLGLRDGSARQHRPSRSHHPPLFASALKGSGGDIWVGSLARGLFRLNTDPPAFRHLGPEAQDDLRLSSSFIMALRESSDGAIWAGTLGGGLNRISPDRRSVRVLPGPEELPSGVIWSLHEDGAGRVWAAVDGSLCRIDTPEARPLCSEPIDGASLGQIIDAGEDQLLVPSLSGMIYLVETDAIKVVGEIQGVRGMISLKRLSDGRLLAGTLDNGLHLVDPPHGTTIPIPSIIASGPAQNAHTVYDIRADSKGNHWIASSRGIERLSPDLDTLQFFPIDYPRTGTVVFSLLQDEGGFFWLGTSHGLVRFDPTTKAIRPFPPEIASGVSEYNRRAAIRLSGGTFLFGGIEGLTEFDPASFFAEHDSPEVSVTSIETLGQSGIDRRTLFGEEHVVLPPDRSSFAVGFASPHARPGSPVFYRYQLAGIDPDWVYGGNDPVGRYTHLPAGRYSLLVQSGTGDRWSTHTARLDITVLPPFWATWWFRLVVILFITGSLTVLYRYKVRRSTEFERLRLRIAEDLHDDIGAGLSSIALLSDAIKTDPAIDPASRTKLDTIGGSARRMVDDLRDIVWTIDPERDNLDDLVERMRDTAAALLPTVRCEFEVPESLPRSLSMMARRELFFIFKEALHNIARHAWATHVVVRIEVRNHHLELVVLDNGIGFDLPLSSAS
ncbi:MAG: sensor histidine kinase, partial [Rhodothermales bacterium]